MIGLKWKGRPPIKIAETLKSIVTLKNEYASTIMDRSQTIDAEFIGAVIAQNTMSYVGRNPAPALDEDGNFQGTDLDLLSFLTPIADRGAVIEIPKYRNRRKIVKRAGERKIGTNQFGPIHSLVSNRDVFSFSVRIHDKTIIDKDLQTEQENIGAYRTYMVVDCDGHWYNGWDRIVWDPNAQENAFLEEMKLWTGNTVKFKYYVHPNRWQSVYGAPYFLSKMLIERLVDEAKFYRKEMNRLRELGFELSAKVKKPSKPVVAEGDTKKIKVKTMEMQVAIPEFTGEYKPAPDSEKGLEYAYKRQKLLTYVYKPAVQFIARADEAAFLFYGHTDNDSVRIAPWMGDRSWKTWQKTKRHALFNRITLSNDFALLYRTKMKTEHISAQ